LQLGMETTPPKLFFGLAPIRSKPPIYDKIRTIHVTTQNLSKRETLGPALMMH